MPPKVLVVRMLRARLGVGAVGVADRLGSLDVPQLTGAAVVEAQVLQQGAHAAVEDHRAALLGELGEDAHDRLPSWSR